MFPWETQLSRVVLAIDQVLMEEAKKRGLDNTHLKTIHPRDLSPEQKVALVNLLHQILREERNAR